MEKLVGQGAGTLLRWPLPPASFGEPRKALGFGTSVFPSVKGCVHLPALVPSSFDLPPFSEWGMPEAGWVAWPQQGVQLRRVFEMSEIFRKPIFWGPSHSILRTVNPRRSLEKCMKVRAVMRP